MEGGRFGPVKPDREPRRKYTVDYNRLVTFIMLVAIAVLCVFMFIDWKRGDEQAGVIVEASYPPGAFAVQPSVQPTESVEALRPTAEEGRLPVFTRANTSRMRVAITLDVLGSAANIEAALALCMDTGARLTFFPTGVELRATMGVWGGVLLGGHQIENHTYQNADLTTLNADELAAEIGAQTELLRSVTVESYQPHFLRPDDLLSIDIPILHEYLISEGYFGIASWAVDTPNELSDVSRGQVIHCRLDDAGLKWLKKAVPALISSGYELVTLNELFEYPKNIETSGEDYGDGI